MGFPIYKIVMAFNKNDGVPKYFLTGEKPNSIAKSTLANAMDVACPSNFERFLHLYPTTSDIPSFIKADTVSDQEIKISIEKAAQAGTVICPHTATAYYLKHKLKIDGLVVATAHPAKFCEVVEPVLGKKISLPPALQEIMSKSNSFHEIEAKLSLLLDNLI